VFQYSCSLRRHIAESACVRQVIISPACHLISIRSSRTSIKQFTRPLPRLDLKQPVVRPVAGTRMAVPEHFAAALPPLAVSALVAAASSSGVCLNRPDAFGHVE
jgi:hypothetical protein